eukprot:Tamp_14480.p1 GENE.Tamp_14480~~Tamp_14480.p1  ORF type:complete len:387 (-),score=58.66 Tamp_14480:464-1600(-)
MEKFRTFEDPATGIMPFMPHKAIVSKNPLFRLVRAGMGLCLVLLRLPILLVLTCILVIGSALASLVPVAALRRPLVRLVDGTCCRLLLLTLGFFWIPAGYLKKRAVTVSKAGKANQAKWPPLSAAVSGTIIVSALTSYLDVLYLAFRFSPVFAFPVHDPKGSRATDKVVAMGTLGAMSHMASCASLHDCAGVDIGDLVAQSQVDRRGPVVIFAEGVTSNGKGILPFLPPVAPSADGAASSIEGAGLEGQAWHKGRMPDCFALVIRYPFKYYSPTYTVGSLTGHCLFGVCWQVYNCMEVSFLDDKVTELKAVDQGLAPSQRAGASWSDKVREAMVAAASSPKVPVRAVVPRAGVTNLGTSQALSALQVKRLFREAWAKA